jgi:hypothetical protein
LIASGGRRIVTAHFFKTSKHKTGSQRKTSGLPNGIECSLIKARGRASRQTARALGAGEQLTLTTAESNPFSCCVPGFASQARRGSRGEQADMRMSGRRSVLVHDGHIRFIASDV